MVWAGVDYAEIAARAAAEADVIVWDGGNNDFPFLRPISCSWWPTRSGRATPRAITRARPCSAWPTWSS